MENLFKKSDSPRNWHFVETHPCHHIRYQFFSGVLKFVKVSLNFNDMLNTHNEPKIVVYPDNQKFFNMSFEIMSFFQKMN